MLTRLAICLTTGLLAASFCSAQENQTSGSKPSERIIGTVTAVDAATHTVTVKEDKTGTQYTVQLANTRTLLKVEPGAKDLKSATRITADDFAVGDRVQIGGSKTAGNPNEIVARSALLMSARDLRQAHQAQAAAWQHSTPGVVTAVDAAGQKLNVTEPTPQGAKPLTVDAAKAEFTRYSPETPQTPTPSQLADIQPGDQVRIIGDMSPDGSSITAQRIYSSSFRTVVGTVSSIAPDGKEMTVKNLQTKQPVTVTLNDESAVRKLPPPLAYALARRFNPDFRPPGGPSGGGSGEETGQSSVAETPPHGAKADGTEASGAKAGEAPGGENAGAGARSPGTTEGSHQGMHGAANGDLSQMLDRLPKISLTDLKPGDAVVISGSPTSADKSHLLASNVIAGVEPIFQSAAPRQAQSLGDWGASLGGGGMDMGSGMPGGPPQ